MPSKQLSALILAFFLALTLFAAEPPQKPSGIFSELRVGQAIQLRDDGSSYSLSYHEKEIVLNHTVIEIGDDFLVVEDIAGVTSVRIPIYAVKEISVVKM